MKILFVSSGKSGKVGDVVKNQGESLVKAGLIVDYLVINSGLQGYISAIPKIRKTFRRGRYDLIHAHYSFSAISSTLAGNMPLVVSLMGSDIYASGISRYLLRYFYNFRWDATIVKTQRMKEILGLKNTFIIPNGVDFERFKPISKEIARKRIGYAWQKKLLVFVSNPARAEKNYVLASQAVKLLDNKDVELMPVYNVANEEIPFYLNAADALLLTSKWEGSVNVVKEAMACNCPIISTDVGDVSWVIGDTEGCFIASPYKKDLAAKIELVLAKDIRTQGRNRLIMLGLDSESVAEKIKEVYNLVKQ
jgi:teichuronic acid biosynthesis glycosyltransferase TuaC